MLDSASAVFSTAMFDLSKYRKKGLGIWQMALYRISGASLSLEYIATKAVSCKAVPIVLGPMRDSSRNLLFRARTV
jgi:hypothetical protein